MPPLHRCKLGSSALRWCLSGASRWSVSQPHGRVLVEVCIRYVGVCVYKIIRTITTIPSINGRRDLSTATGDHTTSGLAPPADLKRPKPSIRINASPVASPKYLRSKASPGTWNAVQCSAVGSERSVRVSGVGSLESRYWVLDTVPTATP